MSAGTRWFCDEKKGCYCGPSWVGFRPRPLGGEGAIETPGVFSVSAFVQDRLEGLFCSESEHSCTLLLRF